VGFSADLSDSQSVRAAFDKISQQYADSSLAAAVFNPGGGFVRKPFLELTEKEFTTGYESQGSVSLLTAYSLFLVPSDRTSGKEVFSSLRVPFHFSSGLGKRH